jgi:hypothetical protein
MVRKSVFRFFDQIMQFPGAGAFRLPASFAQQQSGDWTMTGKVPVARIEGQELLPATLEG